MPAEGVSPFAHPDGRPWSWAEVATGLATDAQVRDRLTGSILEPGFEAVFWETVPSTAPGLEPYEQVVLEATTLARVRADETSFAEHFGTPEPVVRFSNLRGDAELVVPTPGPEGLPYPHLAAFLRTAPSAHVHQLWQTVGQAVIARWSRTGAPGWVSTAGMGVYWLHVRLDSTPKYYRHRPYRDRR